MCREGVDPIQPVIGFLMISCRGRRSGSAETGSPAVTAVSAAVNAAVIVLFLCCFLPLGESKKAQKIKRLTGKGRRMRAEQRENTDPGVLTSWLRVLARRRDAAAGQRQSCGA